MKGNYLAFVLAIFILQSCSGDILGGRITDIFDNVSRKTAHEIEMELPKLQLTGLGGASNENVVIKKKLVFRVYGKVNKDEGIVLIHRIVQLYLENLNKEFKLKDYLEENSFTYENLEVILLVHDEEGNRVLYPDISFVSVENGIIEIQSISKSQDGVTSLESDIEIPYIEAIKNIGT